jgi:hypothetical protein
VYRDIADLPARDDVELTAAWIRNRNSILLTHLINIIKEVGAEVRAARRKT